MNLTFKRIVTNTIHPKCSTDPKSPTEAHIDPPAYSDIAPLNDHFQRPYAPRLDGTSRYRQHKFKSKLDSIYDSLYICGIIRWHVDLAALIISVVILAGNSPSELLVTASAYTIGVLSISLPLFGPKPRSRGETDARPPSWMTWYLIVSRALMIGSVVLMFLCYTKKSQDDYEESIYDRGILRRYVDIGASDAYWEVLGAGYAGLVSTVIATRQVAFLWTLHYRSFRDISTRDRK